MKIVLIYSFIIVLGIAMYLGIARYKQLDTAMRILVVYISAQLVSELFLYVSAEQKQYELRNMFMNTYIVIDAIIKGLFFIYAMKPHHYKIFAFINILLWPVIESVNIAFFQLPQNPNNNFIILESFGIVTLSLYYIHWLLRKDVVQNVFTYPHFWIAIIWLLSWSLNLFFWGVVFKLFNHHWKYIYIAMYLQVSINILAHTGIATVLYRYPNLTKRTV